jgi:hypothetical protein
VSPKVVSTLPPADYPGLIEPRRAAQVLATLSKKRTNVDLAPPDRERLLALATVALTGQDRGLGALVEALRAAGLWSDTLLIVTGAVASGAGDPIPYGEGRDLSEESLALPLLVHFPGDALGGRRVAEPTDLRDITRTAARALGLSLPAEVRGQDLAQVAAGLPEASLEPQLATLGDRYSIRSGTLILSGRRGAAPSLCDLALDPACAFDRRPMLPLAAQALYRRFAALDSQRGAALPAREGVVLDPDTAAALKVWGALSD